MCFKWISGFFYQNFIFYFVFLKLHFYENKSLKYFKGTFPLTLFKVTAEHRRKNDTGNNEPICGFF